MAVSADHVETVPFTMPNMPANAHFEVFPILRFGLIAFLFFYLIVALMVIKQILMMTQTIKGDGNRFLLVLAYLHLAVVIATLLFSLFAL